MIRFLLLHRIDDTDRHPHVMLTIVGALIVIEALLERAL